MKTEDKRACPICGTLLADNSEFCPVCALGRAVETQSDSVADTSSELRFEHYQVLRNQDGKPLELGHGGMGVTYKAIDTHLGCPVALKIISAQLLGNESARSRFLREARAAARVRHSNVATVFHLGESGGNYFYAMEFVDGETLEALIRRRGRLEVEPALEIVTQVAAGLNAIHKQHLVHRDIKPSNIMLVVLFFNSVHFGLFKQRVTEAASTEKSIAVLPFDNISPNKDDAYFADGVQDEILNNLAKIAQLKVICRTSVMQYRADTKRDLHEIANALGVVNVLEGTVRRDGNHVRVSTELVDARNYNTIWADSYDRDLTDVFAIQSEIARNVASKLSAQLSPEERKDIEERPTNNLEAYDLYLQAKQQLGSNSGVVLLTREKENFSKAISLLEDATQKDRKFALAYCILAKAHDYLYFDRIDHTQERRELADAAVNEALRLRPDLAEVHLAVASHRYTCYRDFERARVQIDIAAQVLANNSDLLQLTAAIDRVQGLWEKSTAGLERAATLDPRNPKLLATLSDNYWCLRRYREYDRILDRLVELVPDQPLFPLYKAESAFAEKADLTGVRAVLKTLPTSTKADAQVVGQLVFYSMCARDFAAAAEIFNVNPNEEIGFFGSLVPQQIFVLWLELFQGNHPTMEEFGAAREQLYRKVEADRTNPFLLAALALADVALGRKEESIQEARRAMEMRPISEDADDGPIIASYAASVYAWAGLSDLAFEQLNILIKVPSFWFHYGDLKTNPIWDPLRKDPRFDKLLAELAPRD